MNQSEQEKLDSRSRRDYLDVPEGIVGVDAQMEAGKSIQYARPDVDAIREHVQSYLTCAGIDTQKATPVGTGAATGGPGMQIVDSVFNLMKPIGATIQIAKFLLAWSNRIAARKRRMLLPQVSVTLLADHIEPRQSGPNDWEDTAQLLTVILPDVQKHLEAEFPSCNFRYEFRAKGRRIPNVVLRAGDGLHVSDKHVLQMVKLLDQEAASLTLLHCEGWFAYPKVVKVNFRVRPMRVPAQPRNP